MHGGIVMTLIDRTSGINGRAAAQGERMATATLTINFFSPVRVGDFLAVRSVLKKQGRKAIFADAEAFVGDRLVATATGICMRVA